MKNILTYLRNMTVRNMLPVILLSAIIVVSCDVTEVLDTEASDRFTENAIWNDQVLIERFIAQTYRIVPQGFWYPYYNLSIVTDENNGRNNEWSWSVNAGNLSPSDLQWVNYWSSDDINPNPNRNYWKTIKNTNIFFENIDRAENLSEDVKARMTGEMKVIRAFSYFKLISLFGGVPLITNTFSLDDDFKISRNSYDEVMDFVVSELDQAIDMLPMEYGDADKGKITQGAAMAVKSRALLYKASPLNNPDNNMEQWQAAADAAKAVIDLNQYELFDDYKTMFLQENIYNPEMIWQRPFNKDVSFEYAFIELSAYPNGYEGFGQVHPLQNLVDDYETINGLLPENDPEYDPQNPYVDRDPRFYASILYDGAPFKGRPVETFLPGGLDSNEGPENPANATQTGYYQRKFLNEKIDGPSAFNTSQHPWPWLRYAEILLNYAEASYMLGNEGTAREYLNMVRSRSSVDMPDVPESESGEALFDRIVNERRIELVFEQHRWFDVRRWKIAPEVLNEDFTRMEITLNPDSTKSYEVTFWKEANFNAPRDYLLPIPQEEIDKNDMLEQNPGY